MNREAIGIGFFRTAIVCSQILREIYNSVKKVEVVI
jgi:hypothetical protein